MSKMYLIICFVLVLSVFGSPYIDDNFFEAFPYANKTALSIEIAELRINEVETPVIMEVGISSFAKPFSYAFNCTKIPIPAPTNDVNKLKPGHVRVVASIGDSITCGMSAKDTNVANLREYRGISFPIGADPGVVTMPNLLKQFTPVGYPLGTSTGIGKRDVNPGVGFNGAVSGSIASDMPLQVEWVLAQMKAHRDIDFANDWKVLTIWIGSNDLCAVCNNLTLHDGDAFEKNVMIALEYLYKNVPRLFVNLLPNLDVTLMYPYKTGACALLHGYECPCATSNNANTRQLVTLTAKDFYYRCTRIAANFKARNNPQFAVVVQPFLTQSQIFNRSYLSAADCFHPSAISHVALSTALWNSMITPAAQKKVAWNPDELPLCATVDSMLHTD